MTDTDEEVQTEFKFSELDEKAKDKARDDYRESAYPYDDWWDFVYEDAIRMGKMLGIEIEHHSHKSVTNKPIRTPQIFFSGFSSQGDGACYSGTYSFEPEAMQKLKAECNDDELFRIAEELRVLQLTCRLMGIELDTTMITVNSGGYSHSNMMSVELCAGDDTDEDADLSDIEKSMTQLMRDFADWIYKQLESEYDWLMSDECVDDRLVDKTFDELGEII